MKLETTDAGFTIDAVDLARLLDLAPAEVRRLMADGRITTITERGEGEDAGRHRVTFVHGGRRVRLTIDAAGHVLKQTRITIPSAPPRA
ncbi:DUF6522 family protein [Roseitranquillus sediminis]|uniref:DUF6522 family protein n=1 Tax=Roseitranquillus sediminis TaxID=2809051 RepID=UPI001D0CB6B4|nr:DUF6522 family protein [Roseitranquillus sediminis]MBM9594337.1 hypothetical protein [Roseitranquillus sediminis]